LVELLRKCDDAYEDRSELLKLFHVPALGLPPRRDAAAAAAAMEVDETDDEAEPPQLITHKLYTKKQQRRDTKAPKAKQYERKSTAADPQLSGQSKDAPSRKVGLALLTYNEYADAQGEPYFECNPCRIVRCAGKKDRRYDAELLRKWVAVPTSWFMCEYDCAVGCTPARARRLPRRLLLGRNTFRIAFQIATLFGRLRRSTILSAHCAG
jgi:hypothetical protein